MRLDLTNKQNANFAKTDGGLKIHSFKILLMEQGLIGYMIIIFLNIAYIIT